MPFSTTLSTPSVSSSSTSLLFDAILHNTLDSIRFLLADEAPHNSSHLFPAALVHVQVMSARKLVVLKAFGGRADFVHQFPIDLGQFELDAGRRALMFRYSQLILSA
ncbi:hypothetical protein LSTR_LSTR017693 [Laodelphax striatellus]|uniref:Uncharacterized protein n=1 Tax=Laodelphax striatellus TaxID=195883 RepID=A0A482WUF1_LAOST|nr:hypothetical protein LSTR_LSTR017693 [Laodelphax striatellus]